MENVSATVYTAAATDPDNNPLTFTIAGGADAQAFVLAGDQLRFRAPPNFEAAADADGDNVYLVTLNVSDGQASAALNLRITVTDSREGVAVKRIASGFVDPVAIAAIPGDTRLFVAERSGRIYLLDPATGGKAIFQQFEPSPVGKFAIMALAVSPTYQTSGRYFLIYKLPDGTLIIDGCVRSGQFGAPACYDVIAGDARPVDDNASAFLGYGPDGRLYAATPDAAATPGVSQNPASILGKLLRIDNNPDPYAGATAHFFLATTLSSGLRNPRGGGFSGNSLLFGDRGGSVAEEVNSADLSRAENFGWPAKEGSTVLSTPVPDNVVDPILSYDRVADGGVVGGRIYRGQVAALRGSYVFADERGVVFVVPATALTGSRPISAAAVERRTADFAPDAGTLGRPVVFGEDEAGELLFANKAGDIFKVSVGSD